MPTGGKRRRRSGLGAVFALVRENPHQRSRWLKMGRRMCAGTPVLERRGERVGMLGKEKGKGGQGGGGWMEGRGVGAMKVVPKSVGERLV